MFHKLAAVLQHVDSQLTAEEIADALWLANYMPASDSSAAGATGNDQKDVISEPPVDAGVAEPIQQQAAPEPARGNLYLHTGSGGGFQRGSLFRSPAAFALPNPLGLGRALRPFKRRVLSRTIFTLNEEETARRIAETKLWLPVLNAASTRWLEVALVIDEASSMAIWRQTLIELRLLLEREGAFRTVRTWGLATDDPNGKARLYAGTAREGRRECDPRELIDPGGQRLILVVTDGVSPAWDKKNGSVAAMLASWGRSTPVTIVQVLPQRLWRRTTALHAAVQVRLHALTPGPPNQQLAARPVYHWDAEEASTGVKVPVVTLESRSLLNWARAIARAEDIWIPGYVFDPNAAQDNGNVNPPAQAQSKAVPLSAEERVNRFRASASPTAYKLAGLLSTVPVSLPIIRLIQQTMLPQSSQTHTAEVLLGGLLREVSPVQAGDNPDYIEYEFIDGVRELLFDSLKVNEAVETIGILSNFIENRLGQSSDFLAALPNPYGAETLPINKEARRFARVAGSVLHRLGGSYAQLAESYEEVANQIDEQVAERAPVDIKSPATSQDQDKIDRQAPEPATDQVQDSQVEITEEIEEAVGKVAEPQIPIHTKQKSIAEQQVIADKSPDLQSVEESDKVQAFSASFTRRVLILTALRVEYMAVRAYLSNIYEVIHPRGTVYERGIFASPGRQWQVVLAQIGTGGTSAAIEAEDAIDYFNPMYVFSVGIAGGLKDVNLGDVVVATKVYGYESARREGFLPRPDFGQSTLEMEQRARSEARKPDWLRRIIGQASPSRPNVFVAPIVAGEQVQRSTQSSLARFLRTNYGDALAVEMEGSGILRVTYADPPVETLIIRGIADLIDNIRQDDARGGQEIAARHASAFAFEVLAKLFADEPLQNSQTQPDDSQLENQAASLSELEEAGRPVIVEIDQLIETVKTQMQPQARANATANTLQQLRSLIPDGVTLADLVVGWRALAQPSQQEEAPAISQRRVTCGELASIASQLTTEQGSLEQAIKAWEQWFTSFEDSNDPRQAAMASTFSRELMELQEAMHYKQVSPFEPYIVSSEDRRKLVDLLLACPTIADRNSRETILESLDKQITHNILRSPTDKVEVMNIVDACSGYSHGIQSLIEAVRYFEGDSRPMERLDSFLMGLSR